MQRRVSWFGLLLAALAIAYFGRAPAGRTDQAPAEKKAPQEAAAEKVRKALDQPVSLDFTEKPLGQVIKHLTDLTKVPFVFKTGEVAEAEDTPVTIKVQRVKARAALRALLAPRDLDFAVVGDSVLIGPVETLLEKQRTQRVNLDLKEVPAAAALQQLSARTGANILLDKRAGKEGEATLTVRLFNVPLDTAVRLLAEMAGLKTVWVDNVLFVTTEASAAKLRVETMGGLGMPCGCVGGLAGMAGIAGIGGLGGGVGCGCMGGALGFGGGVAGIAGIGGGVAGIATLGGGDAQPGPGVGRGAAGKGGASPPMGPQAKGEAEPSGQKAGPREAAALVRKLKQPISLERGMDAGTPLKDALEHLNDRYDLTILVNSQAFREADPNLAEVEMAPVRMPRLKNVALGAVLRLLLAQVPPEGATYLIRPDFIEVTTKSAAAPARLFGQKVAAAFDRRPLDDALQDLSASSAVSVLVDPRTGDKAKTPVTATLKNDVSLETAVRLLADMAELKAVKVGGALYVTTRENAAVLQAEEGKRPRTRRPAPKESPRPEPRAEGAAR
jgi:hypothetical protein